MYIRELNWDDPISAVRSLADQPQLTFLDSALPHKQLGRYSYIACDPFGTYTVANGRANWNDEILPGDPLQALRNRLAMYHQDHDPSLPPFQGGAAGFFAYELSQTLEQLPPPKPGQGVPQAILHFYDVILAYDHVEGKRWIVSTGWPEQNPTHRRERAQHRADELAVLLDRRMSPSPSPHNATSEWTSNFSRDGYIESVQRVIDLILAGDVFQANIAQRFSAALGPSFDPLELYCRLRALNPAPFAAFLRYGDTVIASSSPERFLKLDRHHVETRPIKGTIARSANPDEDRRLGDDLLSSPKDRAENIMIVDLLRNDLSRVCHPQSVEVPVLCGLESYASVHHLVSVVVGELAHDQDAVTLLRACFPGGSITGAPKIRAMEIIAEIECWPREVYCGAIGFIGFNGNMDTNIAIRTATIRNGTAVFHAGSGITAMSQPQTEYEEMLSKARRLFEAFGDKPLPAS